MPSHCGTQPFRHFASLRSRCPEENEQLVSTSLRREIAVAKAPADELENGLHRRARIVIAVKGSEALEVVDIRNEQRDGAACRARLSE
jgi:hypothetical protein